VDQNETPPRSSARTLAIIAIVVAITAPFWEGALLGSINIHMPMASDIADYARALGRLDSRTAALEQQIAVPTSQLDRLQTQLAETTGRANATADRIGTLAMVELVTALHRAGGFELELAALRGTVPDPGELKPLLDQIEPYAVTGVPSAARLRQEFSRINMRIEWSQHSYLSVAWMVHLLPWQHGASAAQPGVPDDAPELLHRASMQLGNSDMAGAVATVQSINGLPQEMLADWLEDAKARVAADAVVQRLTDRIDTRR
jgi:hypothetical protein